MKYLSILVLIVLSACGPKYKIIEQDVHTQATYARFQVSEITEYNGKYLSPVIGPRDNSILGVQEVNIETYQLNITGAVTSNVTLSYQDVLQLPHYQRLTILHCVEGWSATVLWEGVLIEDLLALAQPLKEGIIVIFEGVDGYTTSMPLKTIIDRKMLLAYKANGLILPKEMGYPFIVVAEDKLGYKWARWVVKIELSTDINYRGYWESRFYSNVADTK